MASDTRSSVASNGTAETYSTMSDASAPLTIPTLP
jgi:hypothetical protein